MIDKNELRVGSLVMLKDMPFGMITDGQYHQILPGDLMDTKTKEGKTSLDYSFPIPLTDDIFPYLGFKKFGNDWTRFGIVIHTRKRGYVLRKSVPEINTVHRLQLVMYALTLKEIINEDNVDEIMSHRFIETLKPNNL